MTLRPPPWPRCSRCRKPSAPDYRCEHEGRIYCSSSCVEAEQEALSLSTLRAKVLERDQGICATCKTDCIELRAQVDALIRDAEDKPAPDNWHPAAVFGWQSSLNKLGARVHQLVRVGFDRHAVESGASLWEMAHLVARVESGSNRLENVVTKCLACHKDDTRELAQRRAARRRGWKR